MTRGLGSAQLALAVAVAVLLLGNLYLVGAYLSAQDQKSRLAGQSGVLEQSIQRLQPDATPTRLAPADAFPAELPRIELADVLLSAASEAGAEVVSLRTAPVTTERVGTGTYRVMRTSVRLRADSYQLVAFFNAIERFALPAMTLDNIETTRVDGGWDVMLDAVVYARGG